MRLIKRYGEKLLKKELKASFLFFLKEANTDKTSHGYGLIRDKTKLAPEVASIASVGYGFAALIVGVKRKWITYEKAYERVTRTLDTFLNHMECVEGFYYHFVDMNTAKRVWNCEVSIIDTAIFICGAILAGEFFGGNIKEKAETLYKKINWQWYTNPETKQFYMGYSPEKGFEGAWDMYAEQLMLYVLAVASPTFPVDKQMYHNISKVKADYGGIKDIIYTYCGTLFTYQFSHAWIDFRNTVDEEGIDWFENSIKASKANQYYCIEHKKKYKTFHENSWGLTACVGPKGYSGGFGALPACTDLEKENDGTVAPCGAIGSIVFIPKESIKTMEYYYNKQPKLWCRYGFRDGYNLEGIKPWYSEECIGIDKGISLIMIENYLTGLIWKEFMKNKSIKLGLEKLGIHNKKEQLKQPTH